MCVHASCVNMTLLFRGYIYTCFFISTSFGCPWIPHSEIRHTHTQRLVQNDTHARTHTHTHTCICKHEHAHTHTHTHQTTRLASFQTHTGPSVCASLLLYSPPLLSISFLPGAPSQTPGAGSLYAPSPSSLSANARIRFGKGSSFLCTVDSWYIPDKS